MALCSRSACDRNARSLPPPAWGAIFGREEAGLDAGRQAGGGDDGAEGGIDFARLQPNAGLDLHFKLNTVY